MRLNTRTLGPAAVLAATLFVSIDGGAAEPSSSFLDAKKEFTAGLAGDSSATGRAAAAFKDMSSRAPEHPLYLAYYGASEALKGRDGWSPFGNLKAAETGADLMEKSVDLLDASHARPFESDLPEYLETRIVVASSLLALPDRLNRFDAAKRAVDGALNAPTFASAPAGGRATIYWLASRVARHDKAAAQETTFLRKVIETAPDSESAQRARTRLADAAKS